MVDPIAVPADPSTWPEPLQGRPRDSKRGLPIPASAVSPGPGSEEERADFVVINGEQSLRLASDRRCGVCGQPMGYWVAFLGGPRSIKQRTFADPPMHPECARAALFLCPHLALKRHKRAPEHRLPEDVATTPGFVDDKPETMHLGVTRTYTMRLLRDSLIFFPAPFKAVEDYGYDEEGRIQQTNG